MRPTRLPFREAARPALPEVPDGCALTAPSGPVASTVTLATTPFRRLRGLLGRDALPDHEALLLAPCRQVHTVGLRFPIDAVFCDADLNVLQVQTLERNRLGRTVRHARCCIERAAGTAGRHAIGPGTPLRFR